MTRGLSICPSLTRLEALCDKLIGWRAALML